MHIENAAAAAIEKSGLQPDSVMHFKQFASGKQDRILKSSLPTEYFISLESQNQPTDASQRQKFVVRRT